jgi:hypothetical protein
MFILQIVGWFIFSCVLMSFIEHQVHRKLMHKKTTTFVRAFEAHAAVHHKHYSKIFSDEPVAPGEDQEIRLTVRKAPMKALPFAALIALVSWPGAIVFIATVCVHHWVWNKIHLQMHKPEKRCFRNWMTYKFLARYHYLHHKYPDKNFNVVLPLADYLLGTNVDPSRSDLRRMYKLGLL